jgi:peroxiredoxin
MKRNKIFVLTALVLVGIFAFTSCSSPSEAYESEDNMDKAYDFELTDIEGDTYKLSDLSGQKVYIKFWASWCSICLAGLDEFKELDTQYKDSEDVLILTVVAPGTSGEMSEEKFKEWYDSQGFEFVTLLDNGGAVTREYGVRGFPTSVIIDTEGNLAASQVGHVTNEAIDSTLSKIS